MDGRRYASSGSITYDEKVKARLRIIIVVLSASGRGEARRLQGLRVGRLLLMKVWAPLRISLYNMEREAGSGLNGGWPAS